MREYLGRGEGEGGREREGERRRDIKTPALPVMVALTFSPSFSFSASNASRCREVIMIPTDLFDSKEASLFRNPSYEGCVFTQDSMGGLLEHRQPIMCKDRDNTVSSVVLDSLGEGEEGRGRSKGIRTGEGMR